MADHIGQQFGNYRLVRLLGKGSFARVYLGQHIHLQSEAAIKLLPSEKIFAAETEKFRLEVSTIARLHHQHIVRVLDFDREGDILFVVLEYAPNGTLRTRHPKGTHLSLQTVRSYVKQVAPALHYAHEQRVIHYDVKPENMLLGSSGQILLSDFGMATIAHTSYSPKTAGLAGTVTYMAPEQLQGKPCPASDQYSLGIVLYEWLSGVPPFQGSVSQIASQHMLASPLPLRATFSTIPPSIEEVVLTTLAKDPKERFASMRALATAFENACRTQAASFSVMASPNVAPLPPTDAAASPTPVMPTPIASSPSFSPGPSTPTPAAHPNPSRLLPSRQKGSRTRMLILSPLLVALLLIGGLAVLGRAGIGPLVCLLARAPTPTPVPPNGMITEFTLPAFGGLATGITAGPDGNLWFTEYQGNRIGRITPTGHIAEFPLPMPNSSPDGITAGPDGNLWFTEYQGNRIGRITPTGGITEFPLPTANSLPVGITVGPDENLWFTEAQANQIGRITPAGTISEAILPNPGSQPDEIVTGPDGNLWFTLFGSNQIGRVTPAGFNSEYPRLLPDSLTEFSLPELDGVPDGITVEPGKGLWFTEYKGNRIGRITPTGTITEFSLPTPDSHPVRIAFGSESNLWFTEADSDRVGQMSLDGRVTEFQVPTSYSHPDGITVGPDGNIWFTEYDGNKIGRLYVSQK